MKGVFATLAGVFACAAMASGNNSPYVPDFTYEKYHVTYEVRANGSYESITEVQLRVNTPQGIRHGGSETVAYISSQEDVLSIEAWTIQPDGTKVLIPASAIQTQDEQADDSASKFSDTKLKVIIFPNIKAGSRTYYKARVNHHSPTYVGHFHDSTTFPTNVIWADVQLSYVLPVSMKVYEDILNRHLAPDRGNLSGIPDLFLYAIRTETGLPSIARFVEVKKPEEQVSQAQIDEIGFLRGLGLHARVLRLIEPDKPNLHQHSG